MARQTLISVVMDPASSHSVVFEDDGKVGYAYLRDRSQIVGEVWVYNCGAAPTTPEWTLDDARSRMPFANPSGYVRNETPPAVSRASDVSCRWAQGPNGLISVDVLIQGVRYARLQTGSKPGWSRLAGRDGPLAKVLDARSD